MLHVEVGPIFLFSHRGALGDFVLTWPLLRRLRRLYPGHRFLGLGKPGHLELAHRLGLVDAWHDAEAAALLPFYQGEAWPAILGDPDAALVWTREDPRLRELLRRVPGPVVLHPPFPEGNLHVIEHHLRALAGFPGASLSTTLDATFGSAQPPEIFSLSSSVPRHGCILIHPGSGSESKNQAREFYAGLARGLPGMLAHRARGAGLAIPEIRFVLGPAEEEAAECRRGEFSVARPATVTDLAELIAGASLFLGNDSGPSHLAALLGIPTLALYKSTDPEVWGVRGPAAFSLRATTAEEALRGIREHLESSHF